MKSLLCCRYYSKYKAIFKNRKVLPSMGIQLSGRDRDRSRKTCAHFWMYKRGSVTTMCLTGSQSVPTPRALFLCYQIWIIICFMWLLANNKYLCRPKQQDLCGCQVPAIVQVNTQTEKHIPGGSFWVSDKYPFAHQKGHSLGRRASTACFLVQRKKGSCEARDSNTQPPCSAYWGHRFSLTEYFLPGTRAAFAHKI